MTTAMLAKVAARGFGLMPGRIIGAADGEDGEGSEGLKAELTAAIITNLEMDGYGK
jgi:hypothetical protein